MSSSRLLVLHSSISQLLSCFTGTHIVRVCHPKASYTLIADDLAAFTGIVRGVCVVAMYLPLFASLPLAGLSLYL